jgi:hypothetical protein
VREITHGITHMVDNFSMRRCLPIALALLALGGCHYYFEDDGGDATDAGIGDNDGGARPDADIGDLPACDPAPSIDVEITAANEVESGTFTVTTAQSGRLILEGGAGEDLSIIYPRVNRATLPAVDESVQVFLSRNDFNEKLVAVFNEEGDLYVEAGAALAERSGEYDQLTVARPLDNPPECHAEGLIYAPAAVDVATDAGNRRLNNGDAVTLPIGGREYRADIHQAWVVGGGGAGPDFFGQLVIHRTNP